MNNEPQERENERGSEDEESDVEESDDEDGAEYIRAIASTDQWSAFRNNMVTNMFSSWRNEVFDME